MSMNMSTCSFFLRCSSFFWNTVIKGSFGEMRTCSQADKMLLTPVALFETVFDTIKKNELSSIHET